MTLRILLVDDNLTFLTAIRKCLDLLPHVETIAEAHNGQEALNIADQLKPDLVLMDIVMPEMNGLDAARAMQQWPQAPRIVFLSMHDNESYRTAARELGALGFVSKADFVVELLPLLSGLMVASLEVAP